MKTKFLAAIFALAVTITASAANNDVVKASAGFQNPESVVAYKQYLFVSNTGLKLEPLAKDGDGYISMLSRKDGKMVKEKFVTDLNSPKGMFVKHGVLYVADVDVIQGYNIKTKKKVFEAKMSAYGAVYLNDITRAPGGIYVSETLNNTIYKVKRNGDVRKLKIKNSALNGINGLYRRPAGKLFVANFGQANEKNGTFGKIGLVTGKYKPIRGAGIYDGIATRSGKIYVTDWVDKSANAGRLIVCSRFRNKTKVIHLPANINGPSDIYADKRTKLLWIPAMPDNKLVSVPFAELKQ